VSRLEPENRIDLLLQVTLLLRKTLPNLKTVVVGDGSNRSRLERFAGSLGIAEHVIFTGAIYDEIELAPWMLSATLFCYPTRVGLSLLHAFGYGLPVVTTDSRIAQNPELDALVDGVNGLRYCDGNVDQLAVACLRILRNDFLRRQLSLGALDTVADAYSMNTMIRGFARLFEWARSRPAIPNRRLKGDT
jgi:glycosyltransferase involved in cell wall biosynthesis